MSGVPLGTLRNPSGIDADQATMPKQRIAFGLAREICADRHHRSRAGLARRINSFSLFPPTVRFVVVHAAAITASSCNEPTTPPAHPSRELYLQQSFADCSSLLIY